MWHDHPFIQRNRTERGDGALEKNLKTGVGVRQCRGCGNPLPAMKFISTMQLKMKNHSLKIISVCIGKR